MSQSVDRALAILQRLAQKPQRLAELAEALDVHRSTVLRLLQSLEAGQFARRLPDNYWDIGFGLVAAGQRALDNIDLRRVAHRHLLDLATDLGHTIHLAQLLHRDIVYVDKVEGLGAVRMNSRVGAVALVHTAGVAKVILAFADPIRRSEILASATYQQYTPTTITSPAALGAELDRIRERGWAVDDGEFEAYINCVAAPIRDQSGTVSASLSITALRALAPLGSLEQHVNRVIAAADAISAEMGYLPKSQT